MNENKLILDVKDLKVHFHIDQGTVKAVDGVSFGLQKGKSLGIVGESGCGKTVTALSLMLLHPQPEGRIEEGNIFYYRNGGDKPLDIAKLSLYGKEIRDIRGNEMTMIFQEPMTSLNPVLRIGEQIEEAVRVHDGTTGATSRARARELLEMVRIPDAALQLNAYPHELSGGMRQRVMIAIALACRPQVLIADEPTTALDVTVQLQILSLIRELCDQFDMAVLFITHDLGVVSQLADRVSVMYGGKIAETGPVEDLFKTPLHPYSKGLMGCVPDPAAGHKRFTTISGQAPKPGEITDGCKFAPRCLHAQDVCRAGQLPLVYRNNGHFAFCHFPLDQEVSR